MAQIDLTKYGITGTTEIVYNPSYEELFEAEMDPTLEGYEKGAVIESIALRQYPRMKIVGNGGGNLSYYGVFDGKPQVAELVVDLTVPGGSGSTNLAFVLEEGIIATRQQNSPQLSPPI